MSARLGDLRQRVAAERWMGADRSEVAALLAAADAVDRVRALCDEYRANCDPASTSAQVAEWFRRAIEGNGPE